MPHSAPHLTHPLPLIELRHFPIDISPSIARIGSPTAAGADQAKLEEKATPGDATATRCFPYFLYADPRRPQAPPATGELPDPLATPPLGLYPRRLLPMREMTRSRPIAI